MAWEKVGGRRYYYRNRRDGRRVVREYVGSGPVAELAATGDALRRVEKEAARRRRQAERAARERAEAPLLALCELTDVLTRASLVLAGFHQHDRGAWRRRRERPTNPSD